MLHWGDCLGLIEALVPQAAGGANLDETLRSSLVSMANNVMDEISREQRWSQSLTTTTITTANGTQTYSVPGTGFTSLRRVYYVDATGRPHKLEGMDRYELQRVYGDVTVSGGNKGQPLKYFLGRDAAIDSTPVSPATMKLVLYPTPDGAGPQSGNYDIIVEQYRPLHSIVETTGTTTATSTTLTVPSTTYLQLREVDAANTENELIVKGAGAAKNASEKDWLATAWTNSVLSGTTVAMTIAAITSVTTQQTFFYGSNWLIRQWPQVLIFGTLREVASYWGSEAQYQKWEVRFHDQMERLMKFEQDRLKGDVSAATAQVGQYAPTLRRAESLTSIDIRGGS